MKKWPEDGSTVRLEELVNPVVRAYHDTIKDDIYVYEIGIPWGGYSKGEDDLVVTHDIDWDLSGEGLSYHLDRDRDWIYMLFSTAVSLGIEQGRRVAKKEVELSINNYKRMLSILRKELQYEKGEL